MVRKAERQGTPMAPIAAFVSGYLVMWCLCSVGAMLLQWGLHETSLFSPMMMIKSHVLGGGVLIIAGLYQLTPWKNVCLDH
jgi:predicted metal-binding membrane protein